MVSKLGSATATVSNGTETIAKKATIVRARLRELFIDSCAVAACTCTENRDCLNELRATLTSVFLTNLIVGNVVENITPFVKQRIQLYLKYKNEGVHSAGNSREVSACITAFCVVDLYSAA